VVGVPAGVADLTALDGLQNNTGLIEDPESFAREASAKSWLYLRGEAFASMEGGMSYADVQAAVDDSVNIVSDPPVVMDMDLARQHVAALDELPRPTLVTCRTGPRSSAVMYLYAGLRAGAPAEEVLKPVRTALFTKTTSTWSGSSRVSPSSADPLIAPRCGAAACAAAGAIVLPASIKQRPGRGVPQRRQQFEHAGVVAARSPARVHVTA
jgi:hypothetical protein